MRMRERMDWLTPCERKVMIGLLEGKNAQEIAEEHFVSVATVRTQIRSILAKLGVKSQLAAVAHVYRTVLPEEQRAGLLQKVAS